MLRIHQVSCGNMAPYGGSLVDGFSHGLHAKLVCHCWIIEADEGLILVDTGLGAEARVSPFFKALMHPRKGLQHTALAQVERLGFKAADVRHIILTCLDFDHAGGLVDFPDARVHVMKAEKQAAEKGATWLDRRRYQPDQWATVKKWNTYEAGGENWFGFQAAQKLNGLPEDILLVPLPGHSRGHAGVAVKTKQGWMLHAGDSYFYRREVDTGAYHCTLGLRLYQRLMEVSHRERVATQARLRALVNQHSKEVRLCSTHDFIELTAYQASAEPIRKLQKQAALAASLEH